MEKKNKNLLEKNLKLIKCSISFKCRDFILFQNPCQSPMDFERGKRGCGLSVNSLYGSHNLRLIHQDRECQRTQCASIKIKSLSFFAFGEKAAFSFQ